MPSDDLTTNDDVRCDHCGLPVPRGLIHPDEQQQFCCDGCRTVYQVIHGCGLDRFYRLKDADGGIGETPAKTTDRQYKEFDDTVFQDLYYQTLADGSQTVELYLEGVHCAACVWLVEKLPHVIQGVIESRLDMRRSLLVVRWDDQQVSLSRVARTLDSLGYPPHPAKDAKAREWRRREDHRFLIRIGVAGACMGNVMTLAFALYGGVFTGIEEQYSHFFRWASMIFGLISLIWPGSLFFRGAWAAIRTRTAHLDLPIALGLVAGGVAGTVNAVRGQGEIYFDSLTMLVFLLLVGRWIQRRQQRWASDAVELLFSLTPTSCRRMEGDQVREVPIEAVAPDDLVEVLAGDSVPTDGLVVEGESSLDQSLLTGESESTSVGPGDAVAAGTLNISARLLVSVVAVGDQTRVGKLMQLVERCSAERAPIVRFADRVAGWFVIAVLAMAIACLAGWLFIDAQHAANHAIALLIVTCPCALGLATPLAVTVALGRAARRGILIKGGEALELLGQGGAMVLDKTGTVTAGKTSVVRWIGDKDLQPLVSALESLSSHPIALALRRWEPEAPSEYRVRGVQQIPGAGIVGEVNARRCLIGSPSFLAEHGCELGDVMQTALDAVLADGYTPVLLAVEGKCRAVMALGDPLREDSAAAVEDLQQLGWDVHMLSGDHSDVVRMVAGSLGLDAAKAQGGASPEDKVATVRQLRTNQRVVMVGDGVNDAAALSAATVGIAVHGGAEASLAAADIYLNRPGLSPIIQLIHAARATRRTIHRSLLASLTYNAIAATLAICGLISPLVAAILMPISSFTVLAMAYASRTFPHDQASGSQRAGQ